MFGGLLIGASNASGLFYVAFLLCVFAISFCVVHMLVRTVMANRFRRMRARAEDDERDPDGRLQRRADLLSWPSKERRRARSSSVVSRWTGRRRLTGAVTVGTSTT